VSGGGANLQRTKYTKLGKELHSSYFEAWRHFFFKEKPIPYVNVVLKDAF